MSRKGGEDLARPAKVGLSYYSMDVGFLRDKKVRLLKSEFGACSVLCVLYVLGKIYEEEGYYIRWDKDEALIAVDEIGCGVSPSYLDELLTGCLSRSFFDEGVFQMFGVLTSPGIQRRYLAGCEKRAEIQIIKEYWLLGDGKSRGVSASILNKIAFIDINGGNNTGNSPVNPDNSPVNTQSKVKESKVKESKVKESNNMPAKDSFTIFWEAYPKKESKKDAFKAWGQIKGLDDELVKRIISKLEAFKSSKQWQNMQYIPYPGTWIRGERWNDEIGGGSGECGKGRDEGSVAVGGDAQGAYKYGQTI